VTEKFPADSVESYRTIAQDTLALVDSGDQAGAASRITDLETAWTRTSPRSRRMTARAGRTSTSRSTPPWPVSIPGADGTGELVELGHGLGY
jgi:hypothetical protein